MRIRWVTKNDAKKAAKTEKGAINNSIKKWKQIASATTKQIERRNNYTYNTLFSALVSEDNCALCHRYDDCKDCPLHITDRLTNRCPDEVCEVIIALEDGEYGMVPALAEKVVTLLEGLKATIGTTGTIDA